MRQQQTRDLFLYWNRLRGADKAPHRNSIEPSDIRTLLPGTFILQRQSDGTIEFRLAGTALCQQFGTELRGHAFQTLFHPRDRRMLLRLADQALTGDAITVLAIDGFSEGGERISYELLILPLASEEGGERALGSAVPSERPYWLGNDPIVEWKMRSVRIIDPEREPGLLSGRTEIKVPPIAPTKHAIQNMPIGRKIAHLTVLQGGRSD
ncbi:PAS domain-containing protein [Notoacmeibacter sp. MSK16QG-6]|uniref:PAS domain-containing protein n=1 Tax=Notoacmeibacter sp. MSK16QG-6 TaxID=2957982 RepID=UPI00209C7C5C|nr:PAS domain-containing protein [Notoacmeibacter sp. MSK16QG-6]MCP1197859.1 PAS domain-containing protein [Notoacmeibacter sp. MSK16QG-6]